MKYVLLAWVLAISSGWATAQNSADSSTPAAGKKTGTNISVARKLSACKQAAGYNPIKREDCVWSMCKGRWGRNGCPAQSKIEDNKR